TPALCVYNDAVFTDQDWEGIKMIYSSIKEEDKSKVGRFGLGFKSVFHITDYPCIISGDQMLLIDPQKPPERVNARFEIPGLHDPWEGLDMNDFYKGLGGHFGIDHSMINDGRYSGTLFWFPLRKRPSPLSENLYDERKILDLFDGLKSEAPSILIFLRSLESLSIYTATENDHSTKVLKSQKKKHLSLHVSIKNAKDHVRQSREKFYAKMETNRSDVANVTPMLLAGYMRQNIKYIELDDKTKFNILDYLVSDGDSTKLESLHLILLASREWAAFSQQGKPIYICNENIVSLFPWMANRFLAPDAHSTSTETFCVSGLFQLREFTDSEMKTFLQKTMSKNLDITSTVSKTSPINIQWLEKVWRVIGGNIDKFASLPLVPYLQSGRFLSRYTVKLIPLSTPFLVVAACRGATVPNELVRPLNLLDEIYTVAKTLDSWSRNNNHLDDIVEKAKAFQEYIEKHPEILQKGLRSGKKTFGEAILNLQCFTNFKEMFDGADELCKQSFSLSMPSNLKLTHHWKLVCLVRPVVETHCRCLAMFYQWHEQPSVDDVLENLNRVKTVMTRGQYVQTLRLMVAEAFQYLHKKLKESIDRRQTFVQNALVWTEEGFCVPDKAILLREDVSSINFSPYFKFIPREFKYMRDLFVGIGCNLTEDKHVLAHFLHDIRKTYLKRVLATNTEFDRARVVSALDRLASKDIDKDWLKENVIVLIDSPENQIKFASITDCVYDDEPEMFDETCTEEAKLKQVHPSLSKQTVVKLGVKSVAHRTLLDAEDIGFEEWGQREKLTDRLNKLLTNGYTDGLSVPKELIQNADDAHATEVSFLYDERRNDDAKKRLFSKQLDECQGPALWVHNNAVFSANDLRNITKLNGETKTSKTTIGKFGLGFCSVYNLTDVPSFISGKNLVMFDPNETYIQEVRARPSTGIKVPLSKRLIIRRHEDQFKPFEGVFGCKVLDESFQSYDNTLFRLPLRTSHQAGVSKISRKVYSREEVKELLTMIMKTAGNHLLFCQNVKKVNIYHLVDDCMTTEGKSYDDFEEFHDIIIAPDVNKYLHPTFMLAVEDVDIVSLEGLLLMHGDISQNLAKSVGVKTKKIQFMQRISTVIPFGQCEKLTTRLNGLLKDYPCDESIMKELIQNSDDAGATEIHFIKFYGGNDERESLEHHGQNLPALCVYNDSYFREGDFKGIKNLGEGSKSNDPTKTGQFGVGFNAVYHLTDCPSFITKGPDMPSGGELVMFDPLLRYIGEYSGNEYGIRVEMKHLLEQYPGTLSNYPPLKGQVGTMFRLPLRTDGSPISNHVLTEQQLDILFEKFTQAAGNCLHFLKNIKCIKFMTCFNNDLKKLFSVETQMSQTDTKKRSNPVEPFLLLPETVRPEILTDYVQEVVVTDGMEMLESSDADNWETSAFPSPGTYVEPRFFPFMVQGIMPFKRHEYMYAALEIDNEHVNDETDRDDDMEDEMFIYVHIVHEIRNPNEISQLSTRYVVNVGNRFENRVEVPIYRLYKFLPQQQDNGQDIVEYDSEPVGSLPFDDNCRRIRDILREAFKLPLKDRKAVIRRLIKKWYPDKNEGREEYCTRVFNYMKDVILRLERGENIEGEINAATGMSEPDMSDSCYRDTATTAYNLGARYARGFKENIDDYNRSNRQGNYAHRSSNTCARPSVGESKRWLRQAKRDFTSARTALECSEHSSKPCYNWICFICHQARRFEENLQIAGHSYFRLRYPDSVYGNDIPSDVFDKDDAEFAVEATERILDMVDDFVQ
ncbi:SACS-like protein, partial [Mya arenaria]